MKNLTEGFADCSDSWVAILVVDAGDPMIELLVPVAATAGITAVGWGIAKGTAAAAHAIRESTKFRTSLSMGLDLIAKELGQFRNDVNRAMEQDRQAHRDDREEYRMTHSEFDKRIAITEQLLGRHDERISQVEDHVKSTHKPY